jgi:hypothetical protein
MFPVRVTLQVVTLPQAKFVEMVGVKPKEPPVRLLIPSKGRFF